MKNEMTSAEYGEYIKTKSPSSAIVKNSLMAFISGGAICVIGEALLKIYEGLGADTESSLTLVSVTLVFAGAFLTGLDIYPKIAKHAGAGTLVPITGFANAVTAPALEAKTEGVIIGIGAKIFTIAGSVILYGTLTSFAAGIVYFVWGVIKGGMA